MIALLVKTIISCNAQRVFFPQTQSNKNNNNNNDNDLTTSFDDHQIARGKL